MSQLDLNETQGTKNFFIFFTKIKAKSKLELQLELAKQWRY